MVKLPVEAGAVVSGGIVPLVDGVGTVADGEDDALLDVLDVAFAVLTGTLELAVGLITTLEEDDPSVDVLDVTFAVLAGTLELAVGLATTLEEAGAVEEPLDVMMGAEVDDTPVVSELDVAFALLTGTADEAGAVGKVLLLQ